uniref:ERV-BabFcenv provirus ancestral Env polyprotein-like isoform X1 n=1 Tax=Callithrix jacchus TaxID=9483 RepID=UPI0023DD4F2A|nr:ERV-BabFcenv provirus ancestral Env polyprotein-like isoform X1 [Callithrix jacchus]XP_035114863.2 ERV-BabFcenv provirus ancestral Env polyprotein-like isoform X1 [Callithrix jacchus]XP_035114864.2 ERV-BabFcenv provirus ancestral Env polyprotein-like isoform X1 [Callithrix jacchus]
MGLPNPPRMLPLLVLYLLSLPEPHNTSSNPPSFIWRFYLTENYTKTTHICNTPPYSHNHLLSTYDCPPTGCNSPIFLNFTDFKNIPRNDFWGHNPVLCFLYDQKGPCKMSSHLNCIRCTWTSCAAPPALHSADYSDSKLEYHIFSRPPYHSVQIPDPSNSRWTTLQKAAVYDTINTGYPSSHLYIWRALVALPATLKEVHSSIHTQEQTLTQQLQPSSQPFSWLTLLNEGLKITNQLANRTSLPKLSSCLMCATPGQSPLVAVPSNTHASSSKPSSRATPIADVEVYLPPNQRTPVCYGNSSPTCSPTIPITTNLTAPHGTCLWCNRTLFKTLNPSTPSRSLCLPVTLVPRLTIYSPAEFQQQFIHHRVRRAAFLPLIVGLSRRISHRSRNRGRSPSPLPSGPSTTNLSISGRHRQFCRIFSLSPKTDHLSGTGRPTKSPGVRPPHRRARRNLHLPTRRMLLLHQ